MPSNPDSKEDISRKNSGSRCSVSVDARAGSRCPPWCDQSLRSLPLLTTEHIAPLTPCLSACTFRTIYRRRKTVRRPQGAGASSENSAICRPGTRWGNQRQVYHHPALPAAPYLLLPRPPSPPPSPTYLHFLTAIGQSCMERIGLERDACHCDPAISLSLSNGGRVSRLQSVWPPQVAGVLRASSWLV